MKTYEQILDDIINHENGNINPEPVDVRKSVAKEYAKQWVHEFALETRHNLSVGDYEFITSRLEPYINKLIDSHQ